MMNWFGKRRNNDRDEYVARCLMGDWSDLGEQKMDYYKNEKGQKRFCSMNLENDDACKPGMAWYDDKWERQTRGWYGTDEWDKACAQDLAKNHPDWLAWAVSRDYACEGAWELGREGLDAFCRADLFAPNGDQDKGLDFYLAWNEAIRDRERKTPKPESGEEKIERLERELAEAKKPIGFEIYGVYAPPFMPHYDDRFIFRHSKSYLILQFDDRRQAEYAKRIVERMNFSPVPENVVVPCGFSVEDSWHLGKARTP